MHMISRIKCLLKLYHLELIWSHVAWSQEGLYCSEFPPYPQSIQSPKQEAHMQTRMQPQVRICIMHACIGRAKACHNMQDTGRLCMSSEREAGPFWYAYHCSVTMHLSAAAFSSTVHQQYCNHQHVHNQTADHCGVLHLPCRPAFFMQAPHTHQT